MTDPLTGLGNRRAAEQMLASLRRDDSVALIDLDHFKRINDEHGHTRGDEVLVQFAAFLRDNLRPADRLARVGGEEFLVVLTATTPDEAEAILERLRDAWGKQTPNTTFSAGVAGHDGDRPRATFERADRALYQAKGAGRNRVHVG